jgi:MFS family permease
VGAASAGRLPLVALLSANAISLFGNQLTFVALPWFVLQTTGSAAKMGLVGAFIALPALVAAFFGGPLVDRWGHQRASIAADLASGIAVAIVPLLHHTIGLAFWQILALALLGALLDTPGGIARESLTPELAALAGARLERVNAINQAIWRVGGVLGPPLAGVAIVALGSSRVLALDAVSFAVSAALVAWAVPGRREPAREVATPRAGRYVAELREGWVLLRRDRLLLTVVLSFTVLNALGEPLFRVILPVIASERPGGAVDLGLLLAAFAGGGLVGTALFGAVGHRAPRRRWYAGAFLVVAATTVPLLGPPWLPLLLVALALRGVASAPPVLLAVTVTQERVPAPMRARVLGIGRALALAAVPVGAAVGGFLVERVGIRGTLAIGGGVSLLVALGLLLGPTLREMDAGASSGL